MDEKMSIIQISIFVTFLASTISLFLHLCLAFLYGFVLKKCNPTEFKSLYFLGFPYSFLGLYSYTSSRAFIETPQKKKMDSKISKLYSLFNSSIKCLDVFFVCYFRILKTVLSVIILYKFLQLHRGTFSLFQKIIDIVNILIK